MGCGCADDADMVDVVEACEDSEEDEFVLWALFLGMNMAPFAPPSALHACRFMFWKFTGGATAVIGEASGERPAVVQGRRVVVVAVQRRHFLSSFVFPLLGAAARQRGSRANHNSHGAVRRGSSKPRSAQALMCRD